MAWSQNDLDALERAIARGVRLVMHDGRRVEYQSREEMVATRDMIRAELGLVDSGGVAVQFLSHSKGITGL